MTNRVRHPLSIKLNEVIAECESSIPVAARENLRSVATEICELLDKQVPVPPKLGPVDIDRIYRVRGE